MRSSRLGSSIAAAAAAAAAAADTPKQFLQHVWLELSVGQKKLGADSLKPVRDKRPTWKRPLGGKVGNLGPTARVTVAYQSR